MTKFHIFAGIVIFGANLLFIGKVTVQSDTEKEMQRLINLAGDAERD